MSDANYNRNHSGNTFNGRYQDKANQDCAFELDKVQSVADDDSDDDSDNDSE
jgi:hypothetical protein